MRYETKPEDWGWQALVDDTIGKLKAIDPDVEILQVKEKFGLLRLYFRSTFHKPERTWHEESDLQQMNYIVGRAETISSVTCEDCGVMSLDVTTATRRNGFWIKTLCPICREA